MKTGIIKHSDIFSPFYKWVKPITILAIILMFVINLITLRIFEKYLSNYFDKLIMFLIDKALRK